MIAPADWASPRACSCFPVRREIEDAVPCETMKARPWIFVTLARCCRCGWSWIIRKDVRR